MYGIIGVVQVVIGIQIIKRKQYKKKKSIKGNAIAIQIKKRICSIDTIGGLILDWVGL
jgi:hypothetical protein